MSSIATIKTRFELIAKQLEAAAVFVRFATTPQHDGSPHVEQQGDRYHYVITERGSECERRETNDPDDVLYWLVSDLTSAMAGNYELAHRVPGQDCRRRLFSKHLQLLREVNRDWWHRKRREYEEVLANHPFSDDPGEDNPMNDGFLQAIYANPDDDAVRLVYADWLEEQGDEKSRARADFIRAQCGLERLSDGDPRRSELEQQIARLLKANLRSWLTPVRKAKLAPHWRPRHWQFRRGFLDGVTISATGFVQSAEKLFQAVPTLRSVRFPDASNEVSGLADCPYLARLTELDVHKMCVCGACLIELELRDLFASPHAANLTVLNLAENRIDASGARALANSRHLTQLRTLDLSRNRLQSRGARALAESPNVESLKKLLLSGNGIGPAGAQALAGSAHLSGLTLLDLSENNIRLKDARALQARFGDRVVL